MKSKGGPVIVLALLIIGKLIDDKIGNLLESLHKAMAKPYSLSLLKFDADMNVWLSIGQFILLLSIYLLIIFGIIHLFNKFFKPDKGSELYSTYEDLEEKLGEAIVCIEDKAGENAIDEKVTVYMTAKQWEIKRIFGVKEKEIDFIWFFPGRRDDIDLVYLRDPKKLGDAGKLINSSLDVESVRVQEPEVNKQMELRDSPVKQFIAVRNYGSLKLGLAVFIYKENVFTDKNLQEFVQYTTKMLLLGLHNQFVNKVKKKKRVS
jgi:hypothetical protein